MHVFAVRTGRRRYSFHGIPAGTLVYSDPRKKAADLEKWGAAYAQHLETFLKKYPTQWGNLFSFWVAE